MAQPHYSENAPTSPHMRAGRQTAALMRGEAAGSIHCVMSDSRSALKNHTAAEAKTAITTARAQSARDMAYPLSGFHSARAAGESTLTRDQSACMSGARLLRPALRLRPPIEAWIQAAA